jgi:hypothetical protein
MSRVVLLVIVLANLAVASIPAFLHAAIPQANVATRRTLIARCGLMMLRGGDSSDETVSEDEDDTNRSPDQIIARLSEAALKWSFSMGLCFTTTP